ncbi:hypothetical protein BS329_25955 [Amycolatopsis coloradensis]|uniref:Uncharacterized protein n=1 Tax=Amycolatopsis coloradensis TaxID=76021 RepID=A0A1R0KL59_9PSEU|nr:hypothetical protein BS329_25955 [Amycolatopsis coloradensis]
MWSGETRGLGIGQALRRGEVTSVGPVERALAAADELGVYLTRFSDHALVAAPELSSPSRAGNSTRSRNRAVRIADAQVEQERKRFRPGHGRRSSPDRGEGETGEHDDGEPERVDRTLPDLTGPVCRSEPTRTSAFRGSRLRQMCSSCPSSPIR